MLAGKGYLLNQSEESEVIVLVSAVYRTGSEIGYRDTPVLMGCGLDAFLNVGSVMRSGLLTDAVQFGNGYEGAAVQEDGYVMGTDLFENAVEEIHEDSGKSLLP